MELEFWGFSGRCRPTLQPGYSINPGLAAVHGIISTVWQKPHGVVTEQNSFVPAFTRGVLLRSCRFFIFVFGRTTSILSIVDIDVVVK